jgi:ankyrin repeat protein
MFEDFDDYDGFLPHTDLRTTTLHQAVDDKDINKLEETLRNGADVNVQDGQARTPLQVAVGGGNEDETVTGHEGVHGNALTHAATGSPRIMRMLLNHASAQGHFDQSSANRALYTASEYGRVNIIQLLLAQGVSPNAEGYMYGCALEAAAHYGSEDAVQALLAAGAEVNFQGGYHGNALQAAARYGRENLVTILLQSGADVNAPLTSAIIRNHPQVVGILLKAGATPVGDDEIALVEISS